MKILLICVILSLFVFQGGCKIVGGGIAGASYDSVWRRREADNYVITMSTDIRESVVDNDALISPEQHFVDIMRSFPKSVERVDEALVHIPRTNFTAQYRRNTFILSDGDKLIVEEQLPSVFNMHSVRLGIGTLSGRGIIMVRNASRASTGRDFVAIYSQSGEVLYRRVLRSGQVWDIRAKADVIEIIGAKKTRRITINKGS